MPPPPPACVPGTGRSLPAAMGAGPAPCHILSVLRHGTRQTANKVGLVRHDVLGWYRQGAWHCFIPRGISILQGTATMRTCRVVSGVRARVWCMADLSCRLAGRTPACTALYVAAPVLGGTACVVGTSGSIACQRHVSSEGAIQCGVGRLAEAGCSLLQFMAVSSPAWAGAAHAAMHGAKPCRVIVNTCLGTSCTVQSIRGTPC